MSTQDWPGEAAVDVSIVNWVKEPAQPPCRYLLDGTEVDGIGTALRAGPSEEAERLARSRGRSFQGPTPVGDGFILTAEEANGLLERTDAEYRDVVRPYLVGDDIADDPLQRPRRYIIDFGMRALEEAMKYTGALSMVEERVRPVREKNNRKAYRQYWWRFGEPRPKLRAAIEPLQRYIAGTATGKRVLFCWCSPMVCPSNAMNVFAFDDDYAMGVLGSKVHFEWAKRESSTLEDRIRYTPTSAFETFPWPEPTDRQRTEIGNLAKVVVERRQAICVAEQFGLTTLYNQVDDGAWTDFRDLHRELDVAVAAAYSWPAKVAHDPEESNARLLALNREIAEGKRAYAPFAQE